MPTVEEIQQWDNRNIRKHGLQIAALADYDTAMPTNFFDTNGQLLALPTGFMDFGYVTTDGVQNSRNINTDDVQSVQSTEPTRSDISSDVLTIQITFQETHAGTMALQYGRKLADMPTVGRPIDVSRPAGGDQPYRRLLILTQDGVGDDARFRVEACPRVRVTDFGDRNLQRSSEEQHQFTFTAYYDRAYGTSAREIEDGPGLRALAPATVPATT